MNTQAGLFYKQINREMGHAIMHYNLIREGDKILVAVSGGKDSLTLLFMLMEFQKKSPVKFNILAVNLDQGQPDFPSQTLPELFTKWGVPFHIEKQDTYSIVQSKTKEGDTLCVLCSRLRRGILYRVAREHQCNKIALGHHRDDAIQTLLLNQFYSGRIGSMPPIYKTEEGDLFVIRPMISVHEAWIQGYVQEKGWSIIPCTLCGSQQNLKRREIANLLDDLGKNIPQVKESLFSSLTHVHTDKLLAKDLWSNPDYPSAD